jgi:hypothetical protein
MAMAMQDGMYKYRVALQCEKDPVRESMRQRTPDLMATADNPKGKGIFEDSSNRLIDFCYEFFAKAGGSVSHTIERLPPHPPLPPDGC